MGTSSGIEIEAVDHDITEFAADAIVNSANTRMVLGGSRAIAGKIAWKTKGKAQKELDQKSKTLVEVGSVLVTSGYNLPCKYIFHLATHGDREDVEKSGLDSDTYLLKSISLGVENILKKADELRIGSLAVPLIATGTLRLPLEIAIETIVNAIKDSIENTGITQLKIHLISFGNPAAFAMLKRAADQFNASRDKLILSGEEHSRPDGTRKGSTETGVSASQGVPSEGEFLQRSNC